MTKVRVTYWTLGDQLATREVDVGNSDIENWKVTIDELAEDPQEPMARIVTVEVLVESEEEDGEKS